MTGFGSAEELSESYSAKIEIKTLNSKFFDPILKIPKDFAQWEIDIKNLLESGLKRGKINLTLEFAPSQYTEAPVKINEDLFKIYFKKFKEMSQEAGAENHELFKLALYAPEVILQNESTELGIDKRSLLKLVTEAVDNCKNYREEEGKSLEAALIQSCNEIKSGLNNVTKLDPKRINTIKNRLQQSLGEIKNKIQLDENRFEQELLYYIEKLDINEEKVRLESHLNHFLETVAQKDPNGKKLGFIAQEIGREINTIGSKANDADIQREVVRMKEELEKIKEQVLNVL